MTTCDTMNEITDCSQERTISLLSDRPYYVKDDFDNIVVYWYGYAMTYRMFSSYVASAFFGIHTPKSVSASICRDYLQRHSYGDFDGRYTQYKELIDKNSERNTYSLDMSLFRTYFFDRVINVGELKDKYEPHEVLRWLDVDYMLEENNG